MINPKLICLCITILILTACSGGGGSGGSVTTSPATVTSLLLEDNWTCAIKSDSTVKCIGYAYSSASLESFLNVNVQTSKSSFVENRNCSINSSGSLLCWGYDNNGELGRGTTGVTSYVQQAPNGLTGAFEKVSTSYSACAIKNDGALYCWGNNTYGQLGLNNLTTPYTTPQLISGFTASDVAVATSNICIITITGIKCAGYNNYGTVGDGTNIDRDEFTSVSTLAGAQKVVSTTSTFCALFTGGRVRCWGYGLSGQLGNGLGTNSNVPVLPIGMDSGVTKIAASPGISSICALQSGEVYCWGYNGRGTIGNGNLINQSTPYKITSLGSDNADLFVSGQHACVIKNAGTVYCWGDSWRGEAGKTCAGSPCNQTTPILMDFN